MESRFWHYDASFDPIALIRSFECPDRAPFKGHYVNYFGVKIDTKFFPDILNEGVEPDTIPANWHADIAEFGAALRAVELAGDTVHVVELGCGWGCWLNIAGVSARRAGKRVFLQGVEGDVAHIGYAREAMMTNGFVPSQYKLHHGIAAATRGVALFPHQEGNHWGLAPIIGASKDKIAEARLSGKYDELPMVALGDLVPSEGCIDLLHLDIQGGEAELVANAIDTVNQHVAYMVIGTHSRQIEGKLHELLLNNGWQLEIDRPCIYHMNFEPPLVSVDGVQGWRNKNLRP
jgi:hypothetical protein